MAAAGKDRSKESTGAPPSGIGGGSAASSGADYYAFIVQIVGDLKGSVGELKASVQSLKESVEKSEAALVRSMDKMEGKVESLLGWKNRILGGALVASAIIGALAFVFGRYWDYITVSSPIHELQQKPATPPAPSPTPPKKQ